jgi:hypothetical protein
MKSFLRWSDQFQVLLDITFKVRTMLRAQKPDDDAPRQIRTCLSMAYFGFQ